MYFLSETRKQSLCEMSNVWNGTISWPENGESAETRLSLGLCIADCHPKGILARVENVQESIFIHVLLVHLREERRGRRKDIIYKDEYRLFRAGARVSHQRVSVSVYM